MKKKIVFYFFCVLMMAFALNAKTVTAEESVGTYDGRLGYSYSSSSTEFQVWSSTATEVKVIVEGNAFDGGVKVQALDKDETNNVWYGSVGGDLSGYQYSFYIKHNDGSEYENVLDPYGKYLNVDKTRNYIFNDSLVATSTWSEVSRFTIGDKSKVIYGVNLESFSSHSTWNGTKTNKGKLLSLNQSGTSYNSIPTGFDHIKNLGVTYVQITNLIESSNPFITNGKYVSGIHGYSGVVELREVVTSYYYENIGIIIDFDFESMASNMLASFNKIDKNYYSNNNGELDFDNNMVKKYILDVMKYWVETYKISGVKFSNMAVFDYQYINCVIDEMNKVNPSLFIYGDGSYTQLNETRAGENNLANMPELAMLNNSLSYALFGDLNDKDIKGILGDDYSNSNIESLKFALIGGINNGQLDYSLVDSISYKDEWKIKTTFQIVNSLGDNNGLSIYDKLKINNLTGNRIEQKMVLAFGTLMMSGGVPYIQAGDEFLVSYRNFENEENSICTGTTSSKTCFFNSINKKNIDWSYAYDNNDSINAFRSLVNFRKRDMEVIQTDAEVLGKRVTFHIGETGNIGIKRNYPGAYVNDTKNILVMFNYSNSEYVVEDYKEEGWSGLYNYNLSSRDGKVINMKPLSIYIEKQVRPPVVSQWVLLIIVVATIGLLYYANIYLNKKLVEKHGYDITDIKKKYRPFINKNKIKNNKTIETDKIESAGKVEDEHPIVEEANDDSKEN